MGSSRDRGRMGSIGRYIFRTTLGAFLVVLASVTTLLWMTQALRSIDLITNQGQTVLVFIGITGLIVPLLVMLIAPIALTIAVAYMLHKLGNDSELIVMNAAGMPPSRIFAPFLAVGMVVSLLVGAMAFYVSPEGLRELRRWVTQVRAEVVTNNVQPGRFAVLEGKLTIHVHDRKPNGQLVGIMVDDQRDEKGRVTILAERGDILTDDRGVYLVLENGTLQQQETGKRDPAIIRFNDYAFDLSRLSPGPANITYSEQERFPWELWQGLRRNPHTEEAGRLLAEIHNRIAAPLYPLAFLVLTFAYLGAPRTTRHGRAVSVMMAIGAVAALRGIGFVGAIYGARETGALMIPYVALLLAFALGGWGIARGVIIEPPEFITNALVALAESVARRTAAATG
ncbi:MAG TPA: LPS export ABC transporter permease LptF [Xanthobacteraceae bacterium]